MTDTLMNREFEAAFLGACLVEAKVFIDSYLSVTDFATVDHQLIYKAIATVHADTGKTDPVMVVDQLKKAGDLNRVGGTGAIYDLQAPIVETDNAPWYASEIKSLAAKRRLCELATIAISNVIPFLKVYTALAALMKCENWVSFAIAASQ